MMKNSPHPGELIADNLEELGWTVTEAAHGLALSRQQLHNIISGRPAITAALAIKLEQALGSSADVWLGLQNRYDLSQLETQKTSVGTLRRFARKQPA